MQDWSAGRDLSWGWIWVFFSVGKGDGRGRTAGTGPGGMEGRWGRNWCRAGRLGLGGKGGGGRIWRLEGEMELGWGLSGQVRCREGWILAGQMAGFDTVRLEEMG